MNDVVDPHKEVDKKARINEVLDKIEAADMTKLQFGIHRVGSRMLQAILKHGNNEQRKRVRIWFKDDMPALAENLRGAALLTKMFTYCAKINSSKKRELTEEQKKEQKKIVSDLVEPFLLEK